LASYFRVKGYKIPRVLLGTSPFIGAGQFGFKAYLYYQTFHNDPSRIEEIVSASISVGVRGLQVLPYQWVVNSIKSVIKRVDDDIIVVGTILPDEIDESITRLRELNATAALLHGAITDTLNEKVILDGLKLARKYFPVVGLVTHNPGKTLTWIIEKDFEFDLILAPFNMAGIFMDISPEKARDLYRSLRKLVIGKKILGAGRLNVFDALKYARNSNCLDGIAVGVASTEEANETFSLALKLFDF